MAVFTALGSRRLALDTSYMLAELAKDLRLVARSAEPAKGKLVVDEGARYSSDDHLIRVAALFPRIIDRA